MSKLTNFGKEVRKIRMDQNQKLLQMAEALGVSSSFLSAIERGRKKVPSDLITKICTLYSLRDDQIVILEEALQDDLKSFVITPANDVERETVAMFARNIKSLPQYKLKEIQKLLIAKDD